MKPKRLVKLEVNWECKLNLDFTPLRTWCDQDGVANRLSKLQTIETLKVCNTTSPSTMHKSCNRISLKLSASVKTSFCGL